MCCTLAAAYLQKQTHLDVHLMGAQGRAVYDD